MAISRTALADYFRRRAVERVAEIRALRRRLLAPDIEATPSVEGTVSELDTPGVETAVRSLAHQLAGTAAGFGFPALGDLAKKVELAPTDQLAVSLDELLKALEAVAASHEGADPPDAE